MNTAATWTGYGLWALAIIVAATCLLFVGATIAKTTWEHHVRQHLWARFRGPLWNIQRILDTKTTDEVKIEQIQRYVALARRRFRAWGDGQG